MLDLSKKIFFRVERVKEDTRGLEMDERDVLLTPRFVDTRVINIETYTFIDDDDDHENSVSLRRSFVR